jgi:hypothetical protein
MLLLCNDIYQFGSAYITDIEILAIIRFHSGRFEEKIRIKSDFQVSISSEIFW